MAQRKDSFFVTAKSAKQRYGETIRKDKGQKKIDTKKTEDKVVTGEEKVKKPFDKKTYRLKKYSNKYKLEKWEDQRKKKLLRSYYKEVKDEAPHGSYKPVSFDDEDTAKIPEKTSLGRFVRHPDLIEDNEKDEMDAIDVSMKNSIETVTTHIAAAQAHNSKAVKKDAFWRAKAEFNRLKQSKEEKKKINEQAKQEREQKMEEYRKKKAERFKKLSKKTKKGQPVMTGRLELLLEKIEKSK